MAERFLTGTLVVDADPVGRGTIYEAGTPESQVPPEHRKMIAERKWSTRHPADEEGPEIIDKPFGEMEYDELRVIAEREGIPIGNLRSPDRIREVLREAGIGIE